jgi:hypothetical protein
MPWKIWEISMSHHGEERRKKKKEPSYPPHPVITPKPNPSNHQPFKHALRRISVHNTGNDRPQLYVWTVWSCKHKYVVATAYNIHVPKLATFQTGRSGPYGNCLNDGYRIVIDPFVWPRASFAYVLYMSWHHQDSSAQSCRRPVFGFAVGWSV